MFKQNRHDRDKYWKYNVFNSVITAKLVYGLETAQLNDSLLRTLDSFYIRSLRQILNWQPTFLDRANTNKKVIDEISRIVNQCSKTKQGNFVFENISDKLKQKRIKLIGHIIRESNEAPTRQVTFLPDSARHVTHPKKRVGRPRKNWIFCTKKDAFDLVKPNGMDLFENSDVQNQLLHDLAHQRVF